MRPHWEVLLAILIAVTDQILCALDPCSDGYQLSTKNTECWNDATIVSLEQSNITWSAPRPIYDKKFIEDYATFMCKVVKPKAIDCLRAEIAACPNIEKIIEMADESGGTCDHYNLNGFFKIHIIDLLKPVASNSSCMSIGDDSTCKEEAVKKIKKKGVHIDKFGQEANKFFKSMWKCQVELFKERAEECPDWQLPMLISVQRMAMPALFGMKLTQELVDELGLSIAQPVPRIKAAPKKIDGNNDNNVFLLLKILTRKQQPTNGEILVQINLGDGQVDEKSVVTIVGADKKKPPKNRTPRPPRRTVKKEENSEDSQMIQ